MQQEKKEEYLKGMKLGMPIAIGYFPIAIAFGLLAVQTGLSPIEATGMSILVFAGASQFISLTLLQEHALLLTIILATFILNLRHLLMSMSLSRFLKYERFASFLIGFGLTDETFVVATLSEKMGESENINARNKLPQATFITLMLTSYAGWVGGTFFGSLFAQYIPDYIAQGMGIGLYAMFIGLLVPSFKKNASIGIIALISALFAWFLDIIVPGLSMGWIIIIATLFSSFIASFTRLGTGVGTL